MKTENQTFLVTGAAGFIGSNLCRDLLDNNNTVIGVDCFTDYYNPEIKRRNIKNFGDKSKFRLIEEDIVNVDWATWLDRVDAIYHMAAQAGVRSSWGDEFESYIHQNIRATQILLEALKKHPSEIPLLLASSSSVYGIPDQYPMKESMSLSPYSPYGVTKLAAENLGMLYHENFGLPVTAFRFFTVYGPSQRPDMAFSRFFTWLYRGDSITVYGDGTQTRDFTFVDDVVSAMNECLRSGVIGEVLNIGGGQRVALNTVLEMMEEVSGRTIRRESKPLPEGDVPHTDADTSRIRKLTGWEPKVDLEEGLRRQWNWVENTPLLRDSIP